MVPSADARQVAVNTAPVSIPDAPRIFGLTARMYAIVMKVVSPAMTSVRTVVPASFSLKRCSRKLFMNGFPLLLRKIKMSKDTHGVFFLLILS